MSRGFIESRIAITFAPYVQRAGLVRTGPLNLGHDDDYRIPDAGVHERLSDSVWIPSALLVVEILSPDDESEAKLPFYAAAGVREAVLIDARTRMLRWLSLGPARPPVGITHSEVLAVDSAEIAAAITWPG